MSEATDFQSNPDEEWRETLASLAATSAASQSEAIAQRDFEDGSQLLARSRDGSEPVEEVAD